jgi:hypothetical protein
METLLSSLSFRLRVPSFLRGAGRVRLLGSSSIFSRTSHPAHRDGARNAQRRTAALRMNLFQPGRNGLVQRNGAGKRRRIQEICGFDFWIRKKACSGLEKGECGVSGFVGKSRLGQPQRIAEIAKKTKFRTEASNRLAPPIGRVTGHLHFCRWREELFCAGLV